MTSTASGAQINFQDGGAYDAAMGVWSRLAGERFLQWMAPAPGLRWLDIGCGSGAFTELLMQTAHPATLHGVDPSEPQLAFARKRPALAGCDLRVGDAMQLPFADACFDAAVMALVLFFVPEPARGLAEMRRVVRPGGVVSAYLWDFSTGGFPFEPIQAEQRAMGMTPRLPPSVQVAGMAAFRAQFEAAGLAGIETTTLHVARSFADFDSFWAITTGMMQDSLTQMGPDRTASLRAAVQRRLQPDSNGQITYNAHANAIRAVVPG